MSKLFFKGPPTSFDTLLTLEQKWLNKGQQTGGGGMQPTLDPAVSAWVARVQANGGGTPSTTSTNAINTFWLAVKAAGLDTKMIHVNCIAPDNYITATTPLIVGPGGLNQWGDPSGHLAGSQSNLSKGLNGDPSYRAGSFFNTGVLPSNTPLATNNAGISVYISVQEPDGGNHTHGGCDNGISAPQFKLIYDFTFIAYNSNNGTNGYTQATGTGNYAPFAGFASTNVEPATPSWSVGAYGQTNHVVTWSTFTLVPPIGGGGFGVTGAPPSLNTFGFLDCNGGNHEPSAETLSFAAIHQGLTFAQAGLLFNAVQAMRVAMGGGYV